MRSRIENRMRGIIVLCALVTMTLLSGCSLAREDAGEETQVNTDRLVGVFVTTEHLDLFDMEAYLNDNIDELEDGGDVTVESDSEYNGRIYATIDKKNSTEPSDWEVSFADVEGICFFDAKWQTEGEEPFSMLTMGDEICDVTTHYNVTDEGESVSLTGTLYAMIGETVFYMNPVYQTSSGEIYVTSGMGSSISGGLASSMMLKIEEEATVTENGQEQISGGAVELTVEILSAEPTQIRMQYMDNNLNVIGTEIYDTGMIPEQLKAVEGSVCVIVETVWENGDITRELFQQEGEENTYIETFYKVSDITFGKQQTEMIWK